MRTDGPSAVYAPGTSRRCFHSRIPLLAPLYVADGNLGAKWEQNPGQMHTNRETLGEQGQPNQREFCGVMERAMGIELYPQSTSLVFSRRCRPLQFQLEPNGVKLI